MLPYFLNVYSYFFFLQISSLRFCFFSALFNDFKPNEKECSRLETSVSRTVCSSERHQFLQEITPRTRLNSTINPPYTNSRPSVYPPPLTFTQFNEEQRFLLNIAYEIVRYDDLAVVRAQHEAAVYLRRAGPD